MSRSSDRKSLAEHQLLYTYEELAARNRASAPRPRPVPGPTTYVASYYRADGTRVRGHRRSLSSAAAAGTGGGIILLILLLLLDL
ncbi:hypothetical protein [Streptomyces sp. NPDC055189]